MLGTPTQMAHAIWLRWKNKNHPSQEKKITHERRIRRMEKTGGLKGKEMME